MGGYTSPGADGHRSGEAAIRILKVPGTGSPTSRVWSGY